MRVEDNVRLCRHNGESQKHGPRQQVFLHVLLSFRLLHITVVEG
jgi:hypothetical protein